MDRAFSSAKVIFCRLSRIVDSTSYSMETYSRGFVRGGGQTPFSRCGVKVRKKSELPPPKAAAPSATATGQALGCRTWKVRSRRYPMNMPISVILESIPLLHMSGYIFPYPLPSDPSSFVLTPYPQSEP
jgi:hypothetical protein